MEKNKKVNHKKFIDTYENKIKKYRQEYYNNILLEKNNYRKELYVILWLLPVLVAIIILLIGNFGLISHFIALFALILICIIVKIISKIYSIDNANNYLNEIRKLGYFSIEDYEEKVRKYITGPNGYYDSLKNEIMNKYNISPDTRKIQLINGDLYYIWTSSKQDKIFLFNSRSNSRPEIIEIRISGVRYFRCDYTNKFIVLKTETKDFYLKMESEDVLNEIIKEKKFENIIGYDPETYINDFELYMHNIKNELDDSGVQNTHSISNSLTYSIISLLVMIFIIVLKNVLKKYIIIFNLMEIVILLVLNHNINIIISTNKGTYKSDKDYIEKINNMSKCKNSFEELKIALGIKNSYDKVYTDEGA